MKLVYYRGARPNFGDDLNEFIWPRLCPRRFNGAGPGFLGIGTIIGMPTPGISNLHVFSSGAGYDPIAGEASRQVWCVRGPLTASLLNEPRSAAITDGAILAPLIFAKPEGDNAIGVVPHYQTALAGGWERACEEAGFAYINPMSDPASVVAAIASKRLVLAESLHGAIIADAFGVPWIAFASQGGFCAFKWVDWAASLDMPLRVTLVRPPSGRARLRHGGPKLGRWGETVALDADLAAQEFRERTSRLAAGRRSIQAPLADFAKTMAFGSPTRRLLGYTPECTAEALTRLTQQSPQLSAEAVRRRLTERMQDRLSAFSRGAADAA